MALQALRSVGGIETHLVLTDSARRTIQLETEMTGEDFEALADVVHRDDDLAAAISSGSFLTDGMLVIPCSMHSASAIAYALDSNLLVRAADVCLKERRRVVLVVRETPMHVGHLRTLVRLAEIGAVILPADTRDVRQPAKRRRYRRAPPSAKRWISSVSPTNCSSAGVRNRFSSRSARALVPRR